MRKLTTLFLVLTCISTANAANDMCVYPKGLATGLDVDALQRCQQSIKTCPRGKLYRDATCADQKLTQPVCAQLSALAKHLDMDAQMISAEKAAKYAVIKIDFPADGGEAFYILSPKGCLVDTIVNPTKYDDALKRKFAGKDLFLEVMGAPKYTVQPNGDTRFTVNIEGRDQCRACAVLVKTDVAFDFGKKDTLENVVVLNKPTS